MNKLLNFLRFQCSLILIMLHLAPAVTRAQSPVVISGPMDVCIGEVAVYTPDVSLSMYNYTWVVVPGGAGTVLTGNHTGANIQWQTVGAATVELTITDASNTVVYSGSLPVNIGDLPSPFITTDLQLACQPLNEDPFHDDKPKDPVFDSSKCELVCEYSTVRYYANGDPTSTFTWSFIGALSFTPSPAGDYCDVNWGGIGNGEVRLLETTVSGCKGEASFCVEMIESPIAKFEAVPNTGADPIIVCKGGELVLKDLSYASTASPIVSYLWSWGDGTTTSMSPGASGSMISHLYNMPGDYVVELTVVNACGCSDVYWQKVKVIAAEAPKIACPRVVCEKEKATYSVDDAFHCSPSSWSVEGGSIVYADAGMVQVVWDNVDPLTGFGSVMYKSCPPCEMIVVEPVPVVLEMGVIQGPAIICQGKQYVFRMPKWPSTEFNWFVSGPGVIQPTDQRNEIVVTATGSGTIELSVRYMNTVLKCGGYAKMAIEVLPPEIISGPVQICENGVGTYSLAGSNPGSWELSTATGTFVASGYGTSFAHTFTTPGNYRLSVNGTTFCPPEDYFIKVVGKPNDPDVITGPDRACPNIPIKYEAGYGVPGTTFKWSVSGGGSVTSTVGDYAYVTFASLPAYVKAIRVTTDGLACESDALLYYVDVAVPPLAISGPTNVCHSSIDSFALNYTDGDTYSWSLSDPGLGSVIANGSTHRPKIQWNIPNAPGENVWLIAKVFKCGTEYRDSISVFIKGMPTITSVTASANPVCSGSPVTLTVTTGIPLVSGTYSVNWGDGYTSSTLTHTYNTSGASSNMAYTPVVTLSNANGCLGSVTFSGPTIVVKPAPVAVLSPGGTILHCSLFSPETLSTTITTGIGGSTSYAWNVPMGAPVPAVTNPINNNANLFGNYSVTVTNSISGCSSTSNVVKIINYCDTGSGPGSGCGTPPSITLSGNVGSCGQINVDATVGAGATGYSWSASPELVMTSSSVGNYQATVGIAGIYTVSYLATYNPAGCATMKSINVLVPYVPNLRHSIICNQAGGGYDITLYDHSTAFPTTPITSMQYYKMPGMIPIGSGNTTTVFQSPGTTVVYAEVISGGGYPSCISYDTITTPAFPTVSVSLDPSLNPYLPGCADDVSFNLSHTETGLITSHMWNFNDATSNASGISPIGKVYANSGTRFPKLTVKDIYGCIAFDSVSVDVVENELEAALQLLNNPACHGDAVTLVYDDLFSGYPGTYTWYRENTPLFTGSSATHDTYLPGGYWVQGTDNYGCRVKTNLEAVSIIQVPPIYITGKTDACVEQPFKLSAPDYGPGFSYDWSGAATGTGAQLEQTISAPGTYTYYVTLTETTSGQNCTKTSVPFTVTIHPKPAPPSLGFNVLNCNPYEVELNAYGPSGTYNWNNGMSGTTINTAFGGDYLLTFTDVNGCVVRNSIAVPKSLDEYIWVFPNGCFCSQESGYVIGPIIPLHWGWIEDGATISSGWGLMPALSLVPGHIYNMQLSNGYCDLISDDMYYMSDSCKYLPKNPDGTVYKGSLAPSNLVLDENTLALSPNPAKDYAVAQFSVASFSKSRSIELVDISGRVLQRHFLYNETGSITLPLNEIASGMYQIVLRRDGIVVQSSKLSVIK